MSFRERLIATLRSIRPVLEVQGVLVIGSEVPNLLERGAAATMVVSQDVDVGVPVAAHAAVKARLREVKDLHPSGDEPSVWLPSDASRIEVNFVGYDPALDVRRSYVGGDAKLPLLVFGPLSLLRKGRTIDADGVAVPVPRTAGLMLEKLVTDRTGEKGERDLAVVLGLLLAAGEDDLVELVEQYRTLPQDVQPSVVSSLTVLSLMPPVRDMPDPTRHRERVARLLERLGA